MLWTTTAAAATAGLLLALTTCSLIPAPGGARVGGEAPPPPPRAPEAAQRFALLPQSAVRLSGRATIGAWSGVSQQVQGDVPPEVDPAAVHAWFDHWEQALRNDSQGPVALEVPDAPPPSVQLRVPVDSLDCGNDRMKSDMLKALKAEEHPAIEYQLTAVRAAELLRPEGESTPRPVVRLTTVGELVLAGQRRAVEMAVIAQRLDDGRFSLVGRKELKMSDFAITPPTALFGLIQADDAVVVVFDLLVGERDAPARR